MTLGLSLTQTLRHRQAKNANDFRQDLNEFAGFIKKGKRNNYIRWSNSIRLRERTEYLE